MKTQKGITLIALIITIIVMLILVGVSVSVALNTGLFTSAQGAAKNTQAAADAETTLSNGTIMFEGETEGINIDDYVASLKGGDGESAKWEWTDNQEEGTEGHGEISEGDLVTHKEKTNEQFYVISVIGNTVAMLAERTITTTGTLEQSYDYSQVAFCTREAWGEAYVEGGDNLNDKPSIRSEATSAVALAIQYGEDLGGTGRLMTVEEVVALGGDISSGKTDACPDFINAQDYWLGSADTTGGVWIVTSGLYGGLYSDAAIFGDDDVLGVRPVVEILKSDI